MAALGALSVGTAAFLILELSDPCVGLFKMPLDLVDALMKALTPGDRGGAAPRSSRPTPEAQVALRVG